jgi:hypothetical protein
MGDAKLIIDNSLKRCNSHNQLLLLLLLHRLGSDKRPRRRRLPIPLGGRFFARRLWDQPERSMGASELLRLR